LLQKKYGHEDLGYVHVYALTFLLKNFLCVFDGIECVIIDLKRQQKHLTGDLLGDFAMLFEFFRRIIN